jgi:hypothetical protein
MGGMGGKGGPGGMGMQGGRFAQPTGADDREMEMKVVRVDQLAESKGKLAETVIPQRMVVVEGAFPYRQQVEEFRRALRFDSVGELMSDPAATPEFLGIAVQRRVYGSGGQLVSDWEDLPWELDMKALRVRALGTEAENQELDVYGLILRPNRLVMPRPRLAHGQRYPEDKLSKIDSSLEAAKKAREGNAPPPVVHKTRFEELDPWSEGDDSAAMAGNGPNVPGPPGEGGMGPGGAGFPRGGQFKPGMGGFPPGMGGMPGGGMAGRKGFGMGGMTSGAGGVRKAGGLAGGAMGPGSEAPSASVKDYEPPEQILFRFIDLRVEPGRTYEYQVKIRMANPNYNNKERAVAESLMRDKEILSADWHPVTTKVHGVETPLKVTVSDELQYYAVDEKPENARVPLANDERAALQVHRWLETLRPNPTNPEDETPVGDWTILERLLVHRGEYVGQVVETEVPVFRPTLDAYRLAVHPEDLQRRGGKTFHIKHKGVPVDFETDPLYDRGSVLVDFEGGKRTYMVEGKKVVEEEPVEMLVLDADGKLLVHDGRADTDDKTRAERYDAWKKWVEEVKRGEAGSGGRREDRLFQKGGGGDGNRGGGS